MITPELTEYIRGEFAKGITREEIHRRLVADGGWSETDLNEAFRTVIPMQGFFAPNITRENIVNSRATKDKTKLSKKTIEVFSFIVLGLICVAVWYFYHPQIISFWNKGVDKVKEFSASFGSKTPPETNNTPAITPAEVGTKDCGIGVAPDLKNPATYENDRVLNCLGDSALRCASARAILKDPLFPGVFEIIKNQDSCIFKLSYEKDSTLTDITGRKMALQYIMCPISTVKAIDETKSVPSFVVPSTNNLGKYASQIYFYGTLGVFMENNADQSKIEGIGCNGEYISSVIASYRKMQSGR